MFSLNLWVLAPLQIVLVPSLCAVVFSHRVPLAAGICQPIVLACSYSSNQRVNEVRRNKACTKLQARVFGPTRACRRGRRPRFCAAAAPAAPGGEAAAPAGEAIVPGAGAGEVAPGVPRVETLTLENPVGRVVPADDFNRWRPGIQSPSTGLQQLGLDALWYIDPDAGIDGVWDNSLAADKPVYNEDFTTMAVTLREGIFWSDGVEFTADDLIYTVETLKNTPGMAYNGQFSRYVAEVEKVDNYNVIIHLTEPIHASTVSSPCAGRACFIMPKHLFEQQEDIIAYTFNPPLSLGPYVLKDYDPNGNWYLWEKRADWDRTSLARFGEPGPKFAMYIAPGPSDKKVMAQTAKDLDVIHDIAPEGMITLARTNPTSKGWFASFPWAHPDPTLPSVIYNNEKPGLDNRDVRWALTLAIDIVRVAMASYRARQQSPPSTFHQRVSIQAITLNHSRTGWPNLASRLMGSPICPMIRQPPPASPTTPANRWAIWCRLTKPKFKKRLAMAGGSMTWKPLKS